MDELVVSSRCCCCCCCCCSLFFFSVRLLVFPNSQNLLSRCPDLRSVFLVFSFNFRWYHHHSRRGRRGGTKPFSSVLHPGLRQMRSEASGTSTDDAVDRRGEFRRRFVNFPRNVVGGRNSRDQIARYLFREERKGESVRRAASEKNIHSRDFRGEIEQNASRRSSRHRIDPRLSVDF